MKTSLFKFKQFDVRQSENVFEVGTDALVLGGLIQLKDNDINALEVGVGTGVISLMIAQRFPNLLIDAIDLNKSAVECASLNFRHSLFNKRLKAIQVNFDTFKASKKYDLIFSNPPFYDSSKLSMKHRDMARNHASVFVANFFKRSSCLLEENGQISVIIPVQLRFHYLKSALQCRFFLVHQYNIVTGNNEVKRVLLRFTKNHYEKFKLSVFNLRDSANEYTFEYHQLLSSFLLQ